MKIVQVNTTEDAEIVKNEAAGIGLESEPSRQVISEDEPESCRPNRPFAACAIAYRRLFVSARRKQFQLFFDRQVLQPLPPPQIPTRTIRLEVSRRRVEVLEEIVAVASGGDLFRRIGDCYLALEA